MKVALLHYHLKTGGVTTVIKRQVQALQGICKTLVLTGDRGHTKLPCAVVEIPDIGYDRADSPSPSPEAMAGRISESISQVWPDGCDVLHIHNPILLKNRHLLKCIRLLQAAGKPLLLQIHDFAEDGRPQAYTREAYPRDCHYAVINARDARLLIAAGLQPKGVHLVPNAVEPLPVASESILKSCVVYPVRAIRRKNIGEAILLSLFMRGGRILHISQPPTSARDMPAHQKWQSFVKKHGLKVQFDTARQHGFGVLVAAADSMVTTSITEGFGFSFLEPWTVGKVLWGRRLADICPDFEQSGLGLDRLYDKLTVPLTWFDSDGFMRAWRRAALQVFGIYGYGFAPEQLDAYIDGIQNMGWIDFGMLSEPYQQQVMEHMLSNRDAKEWLVQKNPKIVEPDPKEAGTDLIANNRRIVRNKYSMDGYGHRLVSIYTQVSQKPIRHQIDKTTLLNVFLDLNRFSLLKWGPYAA